LLDRATAVIQIVHALLELRRAGRMAHVSAALLVCDEAPVFAGASHE
jgi:hypothetical protein